jgi:MoxR-like ATPase
MTPWPHATFFPDHVELPPLGHLPGLTHLFDAASVWAIRAALGARRPLLVRGEPGTGKSQLARAAAAAFRPARVLVSEVITSRTEPEDLHFRFDAVARLGRAQTMAAEGRGGDLAELEERRFVVPGALWWVFDWEGARAQREQSSVKGAVPAAPRDWKPADGSVLLVDEIDKADADLPNGLLESLGNGEFHVPYLSDPVRSRGAATPLVVITTNEERELPAAFVRRCLVLTLTLPEGQALVEFLVLRGQAHFGTKLSPEMYEKAARMLLRDREDSDADAIVRPGQAEYLDLLRAVLDVAGDKRAEQERVLEEIKGFALQKGAPASLRGR